MIDLEVHSEPGRIVPAADVTAMIIAKLFHLKICIERGA
jgi:hypothetical protein